MCSLLYFFKPFIWINPHKPDTNNCDDTEIKQVNEAYKTLKCPEKRSHYDKTGETKGPQKITGQNYHLLYDGA